MNIARIDLNLLVYLDVLLREKNVTKAAGQLGITQPAMSNGLKRLRELFDDPLLIRTSKGMVATERAQELEPTVRELLSSIEKTLQPQGEFEPQSSSRVFRIMASDYAESTLLSPLLEQLATEAPDIVFDILTPSDVTFLDIERGKVDMAINRFDELPQSFHQKIIWKDTFSCLMSRRNPVLKNFDMDTYLQCRHIWVSKTGMGVGVGINPQKLGWVDDALARVDKKRRIRVFTRHYQVAALLAKQNDLIATLPTRAARLQSDNDDLVIVAPPFEIPPIELKMAWSPLLHSNSDHIWLRRKLGEVAASLK